MTPDTVSFHTETVPAVKAILAQNIDSKSRLRLFYGDAKTGLDWMEEFNMVGRVSCSMGPTKIPILVSSARSYGGYAILTHCIVKIQEGKNVLYQHPTYHQGTFTISDPPARIGDTDMKAEGFTHGVYVNDENYANFKSLMAATRYVAYIKGERNSK